MYLEKLRRSISPNSQYNLVNRGERDRRRGSGVSRFGRTIRRITERIVRIVRLANKIKCCKWAGNVHC